MIRFISFKNPKTKYNYREKRKKNGRFDIFSVKKNRFEAKNGKKGPKSLITQFKREKKVFGIRINV